MLLDRQQRAERRFERADHRDDQGGSGGYVRSAGLSGKVDGPPDGIGGLCDEPGVELGRRQLELDLGPLEQRGCAQPGGGGGRPEQTGGFVIRETAVGEIGGPTEVGDGVGPFLRSGRTADGVERQLHQLFLADGRPILLEQSSGPAVEVTRRPDGTAV